MNNCVQDDWQNIPHIVDDPVNDCGDSMWQLTARQKAAVQSNSSPTTACYQPSSEQTCRQCLMKFRNDYIEHSEEKDPSSGGNNLFKCLFSKVPFDIWQSHSIDFRTSSTIAYMFATTSHLKILNTRMGQIMKNDAAN